MLLSLVSCIILEDSRFLCVRPLCLYDFFVLFVLVGWGRLRGTLLRLKILNVNWRAVDFVNENRWIFFLQKCILILCYISVALDLKLNHTITSIGH